MLKYVFVCSVVAATCLPSADAFLFNATESRDIWNSLAGTLTDGMKFIKKKTNDAASFITGGLKGAVAMGKAYIDKDLANHPTADQYFHARGSYEAAKHGEGGKWVAGAVGDVMQFMDRLRGRKASDRAAMQEAGKYGLEGGDPNTFRPRGLSPEYRK